MLKHAFNFWECLWVSQFPLIMFKVVQSGIKKSLIELLFFSERFSSLNALDSIGNLGKDTHISLAVWNQIMVKRLSFFTFLKKKLFYVLLMDFQKVNFFIFDFLNQIQVLGSISLITCSSEFQEKLLQNLSFLLVIEKKQRVVNSITHYKSILYKSYGKFYFNKIL